MSSCNIGKTLILGIQRTLAVTREVFLDPGLCLCKYRKVHGKPTAWDSWM